MQDKPQEPSLKLRTARSLKWNLIDRVASQILYAVTGIVLARELSQEDFGLVGAILVFQAFASLMVDSGFSYALIQRKAPTHEDYSTVLWFNLSVSGILYVILFFAAPGIAYLFGADERLIPLSRVMFLSFILNGASIVQTNRFMKQMNVRPVAIANSVGLAAGGIVGIWLAVTGFGAWAIVWQTIVLAVVKGLYLWLAARWLPLFYFSWTRLKSFFKIGGSMMFTSFLNTLFLNIYSFFVGNRAGLVSLGYYTQGDKWSKMCVSSLSQVLTSSFLPVLSKYQDRETDFRRVSLKMNRMTAYLTFPIFIGLIVEAEPIFHLLFGTKWDASIILFQLLLVRGIFTVFTSLYSNYLLSVGHAASIARLEVWRDLIALAGLFATFPVLAESVPGNPVWGISIMLWGQILAAAVAWGLTIVYVCRYCPLKERNLLSDYLPYLAMSLVLAVLMYLAGKMSQTPWIQIATETLIGGAGYLAINKIFGSKIQIDAFSYLRGRL